MEVLIDLNSVLIYEGCCFYASQDLVRSARFEQIWKSRRERLKGDDDSLCEMCHLYDVVQVDIQNENSRKVQQQE